MDDQFSAGPSALWELVEPSRWQRLQDHFAGVLGISIRTVSASHDLLVNPSWPVGVPADQLIDQCKIGEELESLLPTADPLTDTSSLTTALGISFSAVPIRVRSDQILAYIVMGPMILGPREDEAVFRQRVSALGMDANALWPIMLSVRSYSFTGIRSVLNLLEEVTASLVQFAYQARQLHAILPPASKADEAVIGYYTDRVLQSLLETATLATKAEGGSVMVYDPQSKTLQIQVAQGLAEQVISSTRLKPGEGIAGLAAVGREILIVDEQVTDERIKSRMTRREIVSSIVAPLAADGRSEPFGILNLRTSDHQRRFASEQLEVLRRLLDLAGAALSSLRVSSRPT